MEDFDSLLNSMFWCMLIGGLIQLVVLIVLIVKFLGIASDVNALRNSVASTSKQDFKRDFYKWIACGDKERAKEVLMKEIGNSHEFSQLISGGNEQYISGVKDSLKKKYGTEIQLCDVKLNLDIIQG